MKLKVGDKVRWKKAEQNPYAWQLKDKITATGFIVGICPGSCYPYEATSSESVHPGEAFYATEEELDKVPLNMTNK